MARTPREPGCNPAVGPSVQTQDAALAEVVRWIVEACREHVFPRDERREHSIGQGCYATLMHSKGKSNKDTNAKPRQSIS